MLIWCYPVIQLYANYKQGMGEDFSKATPAGTFDFQVRDRRHSAMPAYGFLKDTQANALVYL